MNIYQRITKQFQQLVANGPQHLKSVIQKSPRGYIVGIPAEGKGIGASVRIEDYDRYSVVLHHLEVYNNSLTINIKKAETYLRQCAAEISQRLTYLEEPLALLELDTLKRMGQLRSSPPQKAGNEIMYWEVNVWAEPYPHARLTRYCWATSAYERTPRHHPLTVSMLARIAEDVAGSLVGT